MFSEQVVLLSPFNTFDKVDPQLIKYFKTEYGQDWQSALTEHLYKRELNNDKKAA